MYSELKCSAPLTAVIQNKGPSVNKLNQQVLNTQTLFSSSQKTLF